MFEISAREFDLPSIMDSGQAFRIRQLGNGEFLVVAGNRGRDDRQETAARQEIAVGGGPERNAPKTGNGGKAKRCGCFFPAAGATFEEFWRDYFDLERDYGAIRRSIDRRTHFCWKRRSTAEAFVSCIRICGKLSSASSFPKTTISSGFAGASKPFVDGTGRK